VHKCNLCEKSELTPLIDFGNQPIVKHYLTDHKEDPSTWPVKLYLCEHCGLTQLVDSCPPEFLYDNYVTLSSWKFQPHVQHEIDVIKSLPGINLSSKIIEIGSNDGMFLQQMSVGGFENTLGIEPAKDAYDLSVAKGINTQQVFLNAESSAAIMREHGEFDLFISRQNLEHMKDLKGVAKSIKDLVKIGGYVLIEVPNFLCNLQCQDYSLWEEHVNYFTTDVLRFFLAFAEVEIVHEEIIRFSGEGIFVIGRRVGSVCRRLDYVPELKNQNTKYAADWPVFRDAICKFLLSQKQAGKKIAVYGAGSRVFCLMNFTGIASSIDMIVDDQLEKQNKFMPGGRLPIFPSESLYSLDIDICLLGVNTENEDKVISKHLEWVLNGGVFWSVLPPSDRLLPPWQQKGE
jgi:2-polyprenyl-3-methyl-5-hydroxy-6-metoxy-1,4-benzoquinol methylase